MDPSEVAIVARNLAENCGYAVFPVGPDKRPWCKHGYKDASKNPAEIEAMWQRARAPLIGIATGEISNLIVMDIDRKPSAIRYWQRHHKRLLPTRTYQTRSGGLHLYFRYRKGVPNTISRLAPGVETKSDRCSATAWFGVGFPVLDPTPPAPFPDWLFADLLHVTRPPPIPQRPQIENSEQALKALARTVAQAPEGQRNVVLFWAACRCAEKGIGLAAAESLLLPAAAAAGLTSALEQSQALRTIVSAMQRAV